jgi:hypothetical protein
MAKNYSCKICNYETDIHCNYKKHLNTKKHKKNWSHSSGTESQSCGTRSHSGGTIQCSYCGKTICRKKNLKRHLNTCKEKELALIELEKKQLEKAKEEFEKKKLKIEIREKEIEKRNKMIEDEKNKIALEKEQKMKEMEAEKNEILKKFNEYLLKIYEEKTRPQIVNNINNINVEQLTIRYVRKHFNDAYNYEDLMEPLLTQDEIKSIEQSPINGCYELIKGRCINDIDIKKRPIHLVDKSRNKYALRKDGQWVTDQGNLIMKEIDKKVSWLIKRYDLDSNKERDMQLNILQSMLSDKYRILDYLNDNVLLKDNAKLIKINEKTSLT